MSNLRGRALSIQNVLNAAGVDCAVERLPSSTRTAKEAAESIGCAVEQIAKSIVFATADGSRGVLVVASGTNRINESVVSRYLGEAVAKAKLSPAQLLQLTGGEVPAVKGREE